MKQKIIEKISAFDRGYIAGIKAKKIMYSEDEVRKLLETQRGNCYVGILTKTKDKELAAIANNAPEPNGYNGWVKQLENKCYGCSEDKNSNELYCSFCRNQS